MLALLVEGVRWSSVTAAAAVEMLPLVAAPCAAEILLLDAALLVSCY